MTQPQLAEHVPEWDLTDRLKKALREADMSTADMAAYLDVEPRTVAYWLRGERPPRTQSLRLWAIRTGVSYDWLTGKGGTSRS